MIRRFVGLALVLSIVALSAIALDGWRRSQARARLRFLIDQAVAWQGKFEPEMLRLLASGADPRTSIASGHTVLMAAASIGSARLARTALLAGADPRQRDVDGVTALIYAAHWGSVEVIELLLKAGTPIDDVGGDRVTALYHAVANGHVEAARRLLIAHSRTDLLPQGVTLFKTPIEKRDTSMIRLLLAHHVHVTSSDVRFAQSEGGPAVVRLLRTALVHQSLPL